MRRLFYCDHYAIPLPPGHRFPMPKYRMVRDRLAATGLFDFQCAHPAPADVIALAHDPEYVRGFLAGDLHPKVMRRIGFPWSPGLVLRTTASVGGTLGAVEDALRTGFGGNLAGGTHHAFHAEGSGYCVFNDMAVAIRKLQLGCSGRRFVIIDLDVHQGDGTASIFANDDSVLTISVHGEKNFPFRKQESRVDVSLPDGTGDEPYIEAVAGVLPRAFEFSPDLIFYQSGVDALDSDTLGRLSLTIAGLAKRDRLVMEAAAKRGVPFVTVLGGGYSQPIERTAEAHANTFLTAVAVFGANGRAPIPAARETAVST